jgi:hypothetical protein
MRTGRSGVRAVAAVAVSATLALAAFAQAEVTQRGALRITFNGTLTPKTLPRHGSAPVRVAMAGAIASAKRGKNPPQLRAIEIGINSHGRLDPKALPTCAIDDIQPATSENALEACRDSLVGQGRFSAKVLLPEQAPFPSDGKIYAFNGVYRGRPAILAHVYGTNPSPTSVTLPFTIARHRGAFATVLSTSLPEVTSEWGYVTGLTLDLGGRNYLSASCPAPKGFPGAVFPLMRASFQFVGAPAVTSTLTRSCRVGG